MDVAREVVTALENHPNVRGVRLVGSRLREESGPLSDWDFHVDVADLDSVVSDLPALVSPLRPLAHQWDRLSQQATYMLILSGPVKVDLLFDEPHTLEPPWVVTPDNLRAVDDHFWDWVLWLAAKQRASRQKLVRRELHKMFSHLLRPVGENQPPESIETAVALYRAARLRLEKKLSKRVSRALEREVCKGLRMYGFGV